MRVCPLAGSLVALAVYAAGAPVWLSELPAVETLRRIWVQQFYRVVDGDGERVIRRESEAPAHLDVTGQDVAGPKRRCDQNQIRLGLTEAER